jgi:thiamine-phosphate pyrophosphorylase
MIVLITDRKSCGEKKQSIVIKELLKAEIDAIMIREKDLSNRELIEYSKELMSMDERHSTKWIINGNIDVAKMLKAWALHISFKDIDGIRDKWTGRFGVSVHSVEEAIRAEMAGADYLVAGNIYETSCKKGLCGKGLDYIRSMRKCIKIPIVGIGGITPEKVSELKNTGIDGVAIRSWLLEHENPFGGIMELKEANLGIKRL